MKQNTRNIMAVAGVISTVFGLIIIIPSFLQSKFGIATGSTFLIVIGLVLLAIAFGD